MRKNLFVVSILIILFIGTASATIQLEEGIVNHLSVGGEAGYIPPITPDTDVLIFSSIEGDAVEEFEDDMGNYAIRGIHEGDARVVLYGVQYSRLIEAENKSIILDEAKKGVPIKDYLIRVDAINVVKSSSRPPDDRQVAQEALSSTNSEIEKYEKIRDDALRQMMDPYMPGAPHYGESDSDIDLFVPGVIGIPTAHQVMLKLSPVYRYEDARANLDRLYQERDYIENYIGDIDNYPDNSSPLD